MSDGDHKELNDWRINQMSIELENIKRDHHAVNDRLSALKEDILVQKTNSKKDLETSKESRASQGKRIGVLEAEMNEMRGVKKLLAVVGTLAVVALGALLKTVLGGL